MHSRFPVTGYIGANIEHERGERQKGVPFGNMPEDHERVIGRRLQTAACRWNSVELVMTRCKVANASEHYINQKWKGNETQNDGMTPDCLSPIFKLIKTRVLCLCK